MKAGILIGHLKEEINEGTAIRSAEAFGVNHIFIIGEKKKSYPSACGGDRHVSFYEFKTVDEFIEFASANNFSLCCLENTKNAKELSTIKKFPANPIFITGHENVGVPPELLKRSKLTIKLFQNNGYVKCLNTSTALSIVLYYHCLYVNRKQVETW